MSSNLIFIPQPQSNGRGGVVGKPTAAQVRWLTPFESGLSQPAKSFSTKGAHFSRTNYQQGSSDKKFGFSSAYNLSPDNGPYMAADSIVSDDVFGTSDFTIELWIKPTLLNRATVNCAIFHMINVFAGYVTREGALGFSLENGSVKVATPNGVIAENVWTHVAWVRRGTKLTLWVDGLELANVDIGNINFGAPSTFYLGYNRAHGSNGFAYYTGYFDELRVTKGMAVYTENFDVPTEPFTL